tara:strand:+ start:500 stop:700 length:201 start_codon:yes stop_codon:yes gene_type:complete
MRTLKLGDLVSLNLYNSRHDGQIGIVVDIIEPTPMMPRQILTVRTNAGDTLDGLGVAHCRILNDEA